jgi:hypothetical protein
MTTVNIDTCAVTGRKIEPGDQIVTTKAGDVYALKSFINQTLEARAELEYRLFGTVFSPEPDVIEAETASGEMVEVPVLSEDVDTDIDVEDDDDGQPGLYPDLK